MADTRGMLEGLNRRRAEPGVHVSKTTDNKIEASPDKVHDRIVRVTRYVRYGSMLSKNYSTDAGNLEAECFGRLEVKRKFKLRQSSAGSSRFAQCCLPKIVSERNGNSCANQASSSVPASILGPTTKKR
jgi:hypothetical protein